LTQNEANFKTIQSSPRYVSLKIPKDWKHIELGKIVDFERGISYSSTEVNNEENGNFFVNLNCFDIGGGFVDKGLLFFDGETTISSLEPGELLIAITEVTLLGKIIGFPLVIPKSPNNTPIYHSLDTSYLKFKNNDFDKFFLYYFLSSELYHKSILGFSAGSTVLHLHIRSVKKIIVPHPHINEQEKIGLILSKIDDEIIKIKQIIEKSNMKKKALIIKFLVNGIKHSEFQHVILGIKFPIIKIPKKWKLKKLNEIADVIDSRHYTPKYLKDGIPLILPKNITVDGIILNEVKYTSKEDYLDLIEGNRKPEIGDIIFTRNAKWGVSSQVTTKEKFSVGQDLAIIKPKSIEPYLLFIILNSHIIMKQLNRLLSGTTFKRINLGLIRNLLIPYPEDPIEESKIVEIIKIADYQERNYQKISSQKKDLRFTLLNKLIFGKERVKV